MKITIRRVGNSLGLLLPKTALSSWGLGEGDCLELTPRGLRHIAPPTFSQHELDEHKRRLAAAVACEFSARLIRAHSLGNLHRWRVQGVWLMKAHAAALK